LQFDQFSFFQFEAANVKGSSFLRFFVNGSQLQILELNHPLPVTELLKNMNSYVYFKDLENQKPASFRLASNGIFPETFTPTQQNAVVKAFAQFEQEMATP